jgi:hypothetical protein
MARDLLPERELDVLGTLFTEAKDTLLGVILPKVPESIADRGEDRSSPSAESSPAPDAAPSGEKNSDAQDLGIGSLKE